MADFSTVVNRHPSIAKVTFGKPASVHKTSANWEKDGWLWHTTFEDGKTILANVEEIPKGKCPATFAEVAETFGFTKAAGWHVGQEFKRGAWRCVFLTHLEKGIFILKTFPGNPPNTFGGLVFLAPGKE